MKYMINGKGTINILTVWLVKKILLFKMSYFVGTHTLSKNRIEIELDLSNYATKSNLKNAAGVDKSDFAKNWFS